MHNRIQIPDTDLAVYPIGLGTASAGLGWNHADADRVFETYLECGGNLIDTAHVYSDWVAGEKARSERVIGDWLERSGKRNEIVLMTKGGHPDVSPDAGPWKSRMSHADMRTDLEGSLRQLRTEYIDLYFYHRDDRMQSVEEEIETMEQFVKEGKIRYYACSNWDADRMYRAQEYCREKGYRGFAADQSLMNLAMKYMNEPGDPTLRCIRGDIFRFHEEHPEVMAMPFSGNCGGFFHSILTKGESAVSGSHYNTENNRKAAENLKKLVEKYHCSITQAVMGFFRNQPFACVPLYATSKPEHIVDVCKTVEIPFTVEDYEEVLRCTEQNRKDTE